MAYNKNVRVYFIAATTLNPHSLLRSQLIEHNHRRFNRHITEVLKIHVI